MVDVSTQVQITARTVAATVASEASRRGLLVTTNDAVLSAAGSGKVRLFDDLAAVTAAFGSAPVVDDATVWFSADPQPQGLYVGRWDAADVETSLRGAPATAPPGSGALDAANGTFTLNDIDVGVDLSSADTYAAVATAIQTAVQAVTGFASATFVYDTDRFVLTLADATAITGGALGDTTVTTDTDIAEALGMADTSDRTYILGGDEQTLAAGLDSMIEVFGTAPMSVMLASDVPDTASGRDTRNDSAAWAQANQVVFALNETAAGALTANETTSHAAQAFAAQQSYVGAVYAAATEKPDVGMMALFSAVDFNQPASLITAHGKTLPGVEPVNLTNVQAAELERKRCNVYTTVGGQPAMLGSYTARSGHWLDAVIWLRWMQDQLNIGVFNSIRATARFSRAALFDNLNSIMQTGVRNGGLQPGRTVNAATRAEIVSVTGNTDFDGVLTAGYIVWVDPSPTDADREARTARVRIWAVGSEAIHKVFGTLYFFN